MSQASSISNLCFQRANEISNALSGINNATHTIKVDGETFTPVVGKKMPTDVVKLLQEKARLHAAQAFLMTNIKAKETLLNDLKRKPFETKLEAPKKPEMLPYKPILSVDEKWGWDQLSVTEAAEFLEREAFAAHIGQFIHKDSILDKLRVELPKVQSVSWIEIEVGRRTPVKITPHHTSEELLKYHEELATLHREHEQKVNYYKAKVKNLVTEENARIAKENAIKQAELNKKNEETRLAYTNEYLKYSEAVNVESDEFEAKRQAEIQEAAALRITVDPRFQETIDIFLKKLDPES